MVRMATLCYTQTSKVKWLRAVHCKQFKYLRNTLTILTESTPCSNDTVSALRSRFYILIGEATNRDRVRFLVQSIGVRSDKGE